jgi:hypothetical protein
MPRMIVCPLVILACGASFRSMSAEETAPHAGAVEQSAPDSSGRRGFQSELSWLDDYRLATELAESENQMLLIYFRGLGENPLCDQFESESLADAEVVRNLGAYVRVVLPLDAKIFSQGNELTLQKHPSFSEMRGRPGVAIIDYLHKDTANFGCIVSQFPFIRGRPYNAQEMQVILALPEGTLTQRTLIYAVRTHPERPASTNGSLDPYLAAEAEKHSNYQARIRLQGHHQWTSRFQRINKRLGSGVLAREVCAESWPGEGLLEAAIECVRSWRSSSGHWGAVRARHGAWGYDMKRGSNGIWYATGIFGRRQ